jgi:hypothetical protein
MPNGDHQESPHSPDVCCPVCGERFPHLPDVYCPVCEELLHQMPGAPVRATTWDTCLRRCAEHLVGFSNRADDPTMIYGHSEDRNVPSDVREGAIATLGQALNENNRASKLRKFGYSTSEDALTWIIFKFLHDSKKVTKVLRIAGLAIPEEVGEPEAILLWGVPVPPAYGVRGQELRQQFEAISNALGERPRRRTEPDVLIDYGPHGRFIIEVKHQGPTAIMAENYAHWETYYPVDSPLPYAGAMRASLCYELARNWRFGLELTNQALTPFTLVYLGPDTLFQGARGRVLEPFVACLPQEGNAKFQELRWNHLLGAIPNPPGWLLDALRLRGYLNDGEQIA